MKIRTERLELVSGNLVVSEAELTDTRRFSRLLHARVTEWPPPLNDKASMKYARDYYAGNPDANGWGVWYFILLQDSKQRIVIGNGGFKGKPTVDGTIEIGYSILKPYQQQGFATEAARGLVLWAFKHRGVRRIIAETLPGLAPSIRVLEKNGFRHIGQGSEPGVIRYEILREGARESNSLWLY